MGRVLHLDVCIFIKEGSGGCRQDSVRFFPASQNTWAPTPSSVTHTYTLTRTISRNTHPHKSHTHITTCTVTSQEWTQADRSTERRKKRGGNGRRFRLILQAIQKKLWPGGEAETSSIRKSQSENPISCSQPIKTTPPSQPENTLIYGK